MAECSLYAVSISIRDVSVKGIHFPVTSVTDCGIERLSAGGRVVKLSSEFHFSAVYSKSVFVVAFKSPIFLPKAKTLVSVLLSGGGSVFMGWGAPGMPRLLC